MAEARGWRPTPLGRDAGRPRRLGHARLFGGTRSWRWRSWSGLPPIRRGGGVGSPIARGRRRSWHSSAALRELGRDSEASGLERSAAMAQDASSSPPVP